jgi:hypothetical protein
VVIHVVRAADMRRECQVFSRAVFSGDSSRLLLPVNRHLNPLQQMRLMAAITASANKA